MRILIQRVSQAQVMVSQRVSGSIENGVLALVAVGQGDDEETCAKMAKKLVELRIFSDEQGLMNRSLKDVAGSVLAVSQFTLYADCRKGRRPYFGGGAKGEEANQLFEQFVNAVQQQGVNCATGEFAADMQVSLTNDGPVTIWLDSVELLKPRRSAISSCPIKQTAGE